MLSPADTNVVERDPAQPGLALLLDADAFLASLRAARPDVDLRSVIPTYLRYKPGTSCTAGFRLDVGSQPVEVCARTHRRGDEGKLMKVARAADVPGALGVGHVRLDDHGVLVVAFPNDDALASLRVLADGPVWEGLLRKMLPGYAGGPADVRTLAYKPERRYTGQLLSDGRPFATAKFYTPQGYESATRAAKLIGSRGALRLPKRLGRSARWQIVLLEWLAGRQLFDLLTAPGGGTALPPLMASVGAALAELSVIESRKLRTRSRSSEIASLMGVAHSVAALWPPLAERAVGLAGRIATELSALPTIRRTIHGDFYAEQVLIREDQVAFVDLDQAAQGDPAADLGNFVAHVERRVVSGHISAETARAAADGIMRGFEETAREDVARRARVNAAAQLLRVAPHAFRSREPDWPDRLAAMLDRAGSMLDNPAERPATRQPGAAAVTGARITCADPANAGADPAMPFLNEALEPHVMREHLRDALRESGLDGPLELRSIKVTRHKLGRRCLIEYAFDDRPASGRSLTVIGKVRAKGLDEGTYRVLNELRRAGFTDDSADGISVPRPLGMIPALHMTLQLKAPGEPLTRLLPGPLGTALAARAADALRKLHAAGVAPRRSHRIEDELAILRERVPRVAESRPEWLPRIDRVLDACDRLAATLSSVGTTGIHRDFYPDQLLADVTPSGAGRIYLLDLDLYCEGDAALDAGNFVAHMTEQALRTTGTPNALADREHAFVDRFASSASAADAIRANVASYATLSLVRQIYISTLFADRRANTERLLALCESRLQQFFNSSCSG